jgi:hypothetical protein
LLGELAQPLSQFSVAIGPTLVALRRAIQSDQCTSAAFAQTHPLPPEAHYRSIRFWRHHFRWSASFRADTSSAWSATILLQAPVLFFQFLEPLRLAHSHAAVLVTPLIERPLANPVLAAQVGELGSGLRQFQDLDDLLLAEPCLLHLALQALCEPRF